VFEIPTKMLLLVAALVWLIAGAAVIGVGLNAAVEPWTGNMVLSALAIFLPFLILFLFISRKHIKRILSYTEPFTSLFKFFDMRSYIILIIMVALGVSTRATGLVPPSIVAFFCCGLGFALIVSVMYYLASYVAICDELATDDRDITSFFRNMASSFSQDKKD